MSRKLSELSKRLAKVDQQVANIATRDKLANFNCYPKGPNGRALPWFVVKSAEEFEADMNLSCPAHGFRRLGKLMVVTIVGRKGETSEECARRSELAKEYYRRLSEFVKSHPEVKDDRDEF